MGSFKRVSFNGKFLCFSILFMLFIDSNMSNALGLGNVVTTVAYLPFVVYFIRRIVRVGFKYTYNRNLYLSIVGLGILCVVFKLIIGQDFFKICLNYLIFPYLIAYSLDDIGYAEQKLLRKVMILLLFAEVGIAIFERLTLTTVFADEDSYRMFLGGSGNWAFRSSGLYGHPLLNAFIVMIITIFIAASNLKQTNKILLVGIAFLGLLCFNERGNIIVTIAAIIAIFILQFKSLTFKEKNSFIIIGGLCFGVILYYVLNSDLGGRLLMNEKSLTHDQDIRLMAFKAFSYLNGDQLLWGSNDLYDRVLALMKLSAYRVGGIENGYITIILRYGLLLGVPIIVLLTYMQLRLLGVYPSMIKYVIFGAFFIVAFTNPHIANHRPWMLFILSYYAFCPIEKLFTRNRR